MTFQLHRCSLESFQLIKTRVLNNQPVSFEETAEESCCFDKTYEGLKYLLIKTCGEFINILFSPESSISAVDFNSDHYKNLPIDEKVEIYLNTIQANYLDSRDLADVWKCVKDTDESVLYKYYDAADMNKRAVYPGTWETKYTENHFTNAETIVMDFLKLKSFLSRCLSNGVFVFVEYRD